jgi:hypothetical protein
MFWFKQKKDQIDYDMHSFIVSGLRKEAREEKKNARIFRQALYAASDELSQYIDEPGGKIFSRLFMTAEREEE